MFGNPSLLAHTPKKNFDFMTLCGVVAAFGLVFFAIYMSGGLIAFFDLPSLLIVVGGTLGVTLINFPVQEFLRTLTGLQTAFFPDNSSSRQRISKIIDFARRSRTEGTLSLQKDAYREHDSFLKKCIDLVIDGHSSSQIRRILEIEVSFLEDRHRRGAQVFQTMGTISPAMGLIGTLIGLVQMLNNFNDPSRIGPAMAVALLTTFYGAILANLVFLPLAGKLRSRSQDEMVIKQMTIEGMVCVADGLNPRLVELRMMSFLAPEHRWSEFDSL